MGQAIGTVAKGAERAGGSPMKPAKRGLGGMLIEKLPYQWGSRHVMKNHMLAEASGPQCSERLTYRPDV